MVSANLRYTFAPALLTYLTGIDCPVEMELGYKYLCHMHDPAVQSTTVPTGLRPMLDYTNNPCEALSNEIHPLFTRYNGSMGITELQYTLLKPALRLATRFLNEPSLLPWWERTLHGALRFDSARRLPYLVPLDPISGPQVRANTLNVLYNELPQLLQIGFYPLQIPGGPQIDGRSFSSIETMNAFLAGRQCAPHSFCNPRILLHSHYLTDVEYLQAHGSSEDLEHIYLRIAITLCHELCHIVWKYRMRGDEYT
jgi:hypothetical protein